MIKVVEENLLDEYCRNVIEGKWGSLWEKFGRSKQVRKRKK